MDQRVAFIADWLRDEWSMTELAERYQISRKTAHKWVERYEGDPERGLADRSRAPHVHGRAMSEATRQAVLALRRQFSALGPEEAAGGVSGTRARAVVAGGQHDWRRVAPRRGQRAAPPSAVYGALDAAAGGGDGAERGVDGGLQGMVSHGGRHAR